MMRLDLDTVQQPTVSTTVVVGHSSSTFTEPRRQLHHQQQQQIQQQQQQYLHCGRTYQSPVDIDLTTTTQKRDITADDVMLYQPSAERSPVKQHHCSQQGADRSQTPSRMRQTSLATRHNHTSPVHTAHVIHTSHNHTSSDVTHKSVPVEPRVGAAAVTASVSLPPQLIDCIQQIAAGDHRCLDINVCRLPSTQLRHHQLRISASGTTTSTSGLCSREVSTSNNSNNCSHVNQLTLERRQRDRLPVGIGTNKPETEATMTASRSPHDVEDDDKDDRQLPVTGDARLPVFGDTWWSKEEGIDTVREAGEIAHSRHRQVNPLSPSVDLLPPLSALPPGLPLNGLARWLPPAYHLLYLHRQLRAQQSAVVAAAAAAVVSSSTTDTSNSCTWRPFPMSLSAPVASIPPPRLDLLHDLAATAGLSRCYPGPHHHHHHPGPVGLSGPLQHPPPPPLPAPAKRLFGCPQCRYLTDRKNNLKRHVLTMHQESDKTLECCAIAFHSKASLRDHVLIFHGAGYMCRHCGRNFCRKALLKRHLTVHSGQKDFTCAVCDYATSHKSNLERHKKVHERQPSENETETSTGFPDVGYDNRFSPPSAASFRSRLQRFAGGSFMHDALRGDVMRSRAPEPEVVSMHYGGFGAATHAGPGPSPRDLTTQFQEHSPDVDYGVGELTDSSSSGSSSGTSEDNRHNLSAQSAVCRELFDNCADQPRSDEDDDDDGEEINVVDDLVN